MSPGNLLEIRPADVRHPEVLTAENDLESGLHSSLQDCSPCLLFSAVKSFPSLRKQPMYLESYNC